MAEETKTGHPCQKSTIPEDIRRLSLAELNRLAEEIREMMIDTVSKRGGHLASSLGTVELTLALHYVFDTPRDRLVWDVGHQAYTHKIITGRKGRFDTLRQRGGISGFPKREESPYDTFDVGHSGTSISAAAGMAEARCLKGENFRIIAVIGDGAMSAGMAFEGLNWTGDRKKNLIIILNDNEMCISPNVGALSSYLNRIMTGQTVNRIQAEVKTFLKSVPGIGEQMLKFSRQVEESLKTFFVPGAIFEELGFTYVGPLEGHRLDHLIRNLKNVRMLEGPVLVHVVTQKGKGYKFAEDDPSRFHGIPPFDIDTGETVASGGSPAPPPTRRCSAGRSWSWPRRIRGSSRSRRPCPRERGSTTSPANSPPGSTTWGWPSSTGSPLPPVWPPRGSSPSWRSIPPSCSAPTTR